MEGQVPPDLLFYYLFIRTAGMSDTQPKNNFLSPAPPGEEYKHMCMSLAQGYELDWITFPIILVNEFGEPEHIDSFYKRHPNFDEDVSNAL